MKTTLLLVEDDAEVRAVLAELLALDGIETIEAENGIQAWDILSTVDDPAKLPHLVLSDIAMPKMNGFQLLDKIRLDPRFAKLPVVLTSGNADRAKADLQAGAARFEPNAFFAKPFDFGKLAETIRALVAA
ncbi:MAG: response regulator [Bdellovibrionales bacterium]|nr:response regulator [Bdellovibrionales bacterium]